MLALVSGGQAAAQSVVAAAPMMVSSPAPDGVAVTVYRAPWRGRGDRMDLRYLGGFALVTETRKVRLPKGPAVLRFEGVAAGIVPVSAIIDGLPGGTVEKNRDARLLSPASLVDGTLGRDVTLTRTDRATGERRSENATIVAGPTPGIVLKTAAGIETLRCSGLPERLSFAGVPAGLSAKPVLSVATVTPTARTATVTLSYLASGFDWSASYVATLAPDDRSLTLSAWLTLANANPERFADAAVQAVAGRLNRRATDEMTRQAAELELRCYPLGTTTSDLPQKAFEMADEIVVTASRMMAPPPPPPPAPSAPPAPPPPEDLGDLKLYRVPERVTVAANAQKQVALLVSGTVPFERRYRRSLYPGQTLIAAPTAKQLVLRNRKQDGLGFPLPNGTTSLYLDRPGGTLLLGTGTIADKAVGETVRIASGASHQVLVEQRSIVRGEDYVTITNANPFAVVAELPIGGAGQKIEAEGDALVAIDGVATWVVPLPAGATAELTYRYEVR
ncbi:hypothetical protein JAO74_08705 [Sphingomonas sp. BT553]|uniref:DUF4139 domain-containing protein n=2 Tax=Sphingomonas mollis TaxID=2795726 RepID=A0ABS0XPA1_9SPHN|nr:hypothetical protein [Sphingomonas sp. BT553]